MIIIQIIDINHPVQQIVKTFEEITGFQNPIHALDGCSAPNFACSIKSLKLLFFQTKSIRAE